MVIDDTSDVARDDVAGPWLSPSEALTRFVPQRQSRGPGTRQVAPIRFGFRVGYIGFLVPAGMLSELVEDIEVYPLPTTPVWFPGLINLRGGLIPVFDLKKLLNIDDPGMEKPQLLVLNAGAEAVGVLIDALPLTLDMSGKEPQSLPLPGILREHCHAVYMQGQDIWVDFDFDGFFRAAADQIAA